MLNKVSFGQYYPTGSVVHRMDPRAKILLTVFYIVAVFFVQSYSGFLLTALLLGSVIALSKIPVRAVLKSVKAVIFLIIFTVVLNVLFYKGDAYNWEWNFWVISIKDAGLDFAAKMALRLLFLVIGTALLSFTTTPIELTDGIESLLSPLKYVKFPVHDLAVTMSIALRFIPTLTDETDKIMMAQKARGADFESGNLMKRARALIPVLIPLFVSAFRRADELSYAMDSRCYNATKNRTRRKVLKFGFADYFAFLTMILYFLLILTDKIIFAGLL